MASTSTVPDSTASTSPDGGDSAAFAALEANFGDMLRVALNAYITTSDELYEALQAAAACAHWQEAAKLALQLGDAGANMGFQPIATAARAFADATDQNASAHRLRNDAQMAVFEYERLRLALESRFPELVASRAYSVA